MYINIDDNYITLNSLKSSSVTAWAENWMSLRTPSNAEKDILEPSGLSYL